MTIARQAWLDLKYQNKNITEDLQPYLKGFSYTDNLSGESDDLQITLEDRSEVWQSDWFPDKGAKLTATYYQHNWCDNNKKESMTLGIFEIDEIEIDGPPDTVKIKALSVPQSTPLKGEDKNRAWEKTKLSVIANDIANGVGMKLCFDVTADPEYDRIEQTEQTDLVFLLKTCKDAGLALKISDNQIVIFDEAKYEQADPTLVIDKRLFTIKKYNGKSTINDVYTACEIRYQDPNTKTVSKYKFTPPNPPETKRILVLRERVHSLAEAERKAKKSLREKNSQAWTYGFTILGNMKVYASMTVILKNFGKFDGKWLITQVTHSQSSGSETSLQLRRCLEGY